MKSKDGRPVYSTENPVPRGRPGGKPSASQPGRNEPAASLPPWQQSPRVRREVGGRGGKTVTTVSPLILVREEAAALLAAWKKMCGTGGSLKPGRTTDGTPCFELEIQGDHTDRLVAELLQAGYKAKRAGG